MSQFTEYADHVKTLDRETYLGVLTWYTVAGDLRVPQTDLKDLLDAVGLGSYAPRVPNNADIFRRTSTAAQRKRIPTSQPDVFINFLVRSPGDDLGHLYRRVVREEVDSTNRRLDYVEVAELVFDRSNASVSFTLLQPSYEAEDLCRGVVDAYLNDKGNLNGASIRDMIQRALTGANATNVRYPAGGVYFLSAENAHVVAGLEEVVSQLPAGAMVHSLPLIDDVKQRSMIRKAFEAESVDRITTLATEIAALRKAGTKISPEKYATYLTALRELKGKTAEYSELLEEGLTTTSSAISIFERQVQGLMSFVEH